MPGVSLVSCAGRRVRFGGAAPSLGATAERRRTPPNAPPNGASERIWPDKSRWNLLPSRPDRPAQEALALNFPNINNCRAERGSVSSPADSQQHVMESHISLVYTTTNITHTQEQPIQSSMAIGHSQLKNSITPLRPFCLADALKFGAASQRGGCPGAPSPTIIFPRSNSHQSLDPRVCCCGLDW